MRTKELLTSTSLLVLILATGIAQAATLFTPPLVPEGENQLDCYLVNVSNKTRAARIESLNRMGDLKGFADVILNPGEERVVTVPASDEPRYCRFIVEGGRAQYRASVLVRDPNAGSISALPAE